MIVTDPTLRPSERFLQAIKAYFEEHGYTFRKSQKAFERPIEKGYQRIGFWFRISTLTDVRLYWSLHFEKLDKLHAQLIGHPKQSKIFPSIITDLANYTRWLPGVEYTFDLYDPKTLQYDDLSINGAVQGVISAYEIHTVPFFEKYNSYSALERYYNQNEFKEIKGILLAKYVENPEFDLLVETLWEQIKRRNKFFPCEDSIALNKTLELLNTNDIKTLLE